MAPIYLDYNASTPIDPTVAAAVRPYLGEAFGNTSSGHWASTPAKAAVGEAHAQIAALLSCVPSASVSAATRPRRTIEGVPTQPDQAVRATST